MSDVAARAEGAFGKRTVALLLIVGIVGFIGTLVIGAYAPDLRRGHNGGAHALSNAATGYAGIVRLAAATGRNPRTVRDAALLKTEDLVVLTPEAGATDMSVALAARGAKTTLVVLPKWATVKDPDRDDWVRYAGIRGDAGLVLAPAYRLAIRTVRSGGRPLRLDDPTMTGMRFAAPRPLQVITHSSRVAAAPRGGPPQWTGRLTPLITDDRGHIVLARVDGGALYVLSDPDLLSNRAMRSPEQARSALALLDWLNSTGAEGIAFDVTLNGFGRTRSPLKLAFEPPFLAMTLAIGATLLLALMQALARFGAPRPRVRAIAFGKAALVDNTALLMRKARREGALGGRYADMLRERSGAAFGAPPGLRDASLDAYLDRLGGRTTFTDLSAAARQAGDPATMLAAARALRGWKGDI